MLQYARLLRPPSPHQQKPDRNESVPLSSPRRWQTQNPSRRIIIVLRKKSSPLMIDTLNLTSRPRYLQVT